MGGAATPDLSGGRLDLFYQMAEAIGACRVLFEGQPAGTGAAAAGLIAWRA